MKTTNFRWLLCRVWAVLEKAHQRVQLRTLKTNGAILLLLKSRERSRKSWENRDKEDDSNWSMHCTIIIFFIVKDKYIWKWHILIKKLKDSSFWLSSWFYLRQFLYNRLFMVIVLLIVLNPTLILVYLITILVETNWSHLLHHSFLLIFLLLLFNPPFSSIIHSTCPLSLSTFFYFSIESRIGLLDNFSSESVDLCFLFRIHYCSWYISNTPWISSTSPSLLFYLFHNKSN